MSLKHKLFAEENAMELGNLTSLSPLYSNGMPLNQWDDDDEEFEDDEDLDMDDDDLDEEWDDEEFDVDEEDFDLDEEEEMDFDTFDDEDDDDEDGFYDDEPEDMGHRVEDSNPSPRKSQYSLDVEFV